MAYSLDMGGVSPRRFVGKRQTEPRLPSHIPSVDGAPSIVGPGQSGVLQPQILVRKSVDNTVRWSEGERLDHLFEQRCDQFTGTGKDQAVVTDDVSLSFRELDNLANQVARYLLDQGIGSGDRVGLLFDRTIDSYVALLAVLKVNAAYVPLDAGFPTERVRFILQDAGVKSVVSLSAFRGKLDEFAVRQILLDTAEREISAKPKTRLTDAEKAPPVDQLAYLIYTSGTTGNPKGVVIEHPSICNFVRVAAELYGFRPGDRVYQGMTIAFDFSVEELWVPLIAGATLVPGKPGASLVGDDLADFLRQRKVTGLCCVPTLLATIEKDLPDLRILLVSGEACPHNLMVRWHRPGRTILNAYGPTEATVTATLTELHPDKPVTIGGPLPTYSIVILDPHKDEALSPGEMGEIGIAGIGLAAGYLNRDDLTQKKFIADFLQIPNNPSGRIYRTGDLGRINEQDEVEFHGRIDTQVKIRGYRIELTEIESVLLELPQIAQAAVITHESEPGMVELAAYYSLKQGVKELPHAEVSEALRSRLPAYMVPAYLEHLPIIPMTVANKADHKKLPAPKGPRFSVGAAKFVAPRGETETILARRAGRGAQARAGVGRGQLLQGPGRAFAADGALLRQDPAASGPVGRLDARHLPQPDHRQARRPSGRGGGGRNPGREQAGAVPHSVQSRILRLRRAAAPVLCRLWLARALPPRRWIRMDLCGGRPAGRALSAPRVLWLRHLRPAQRHSDRRQVAADRQVEAGGDPDLEPALLPLLGGEDARAKRADGGARHPDLQSLSAAARRQDRAQHRHQLALRSGLHRSVLGRRQHDPAEGLDPARLQGAIELHLYRLDRDRRQRLCRPGQRARHRHRHGQRHPARARLVAAERPARPRRQALSRLARAGDAGRLLPGRAHGVQLAAALALCRHPGGHRHGNLRADLDHDPLPLVPGPSRG